MKRITYLGLGAMGTGIALSLIRGGYDLTVWSRHAEHTQPVVDEGATAAPDIHSAVKHAQVIMYCLSDEAAVEEVVFGPAGILAAVSSGQIVIDNTTVHPATSRRQAQAYAEKQVEFLDVPVFGGPHEAEEAGLWVVAGGSQKTFHRVHPILTVIGDSVHYMGDHGQGSAMALVGSLVMAAQLQALSEALILAAKSHLNLREVLAVLGVTDFRSPLLKGVGAALLKRDFGASYALKYLLEDANLIERFARELHAPIPAFAAIRATLQTAVNQGHGEENASALIKALEKQAEIQVGPA